MVVERERSGTEINFFFFRPHFFHSSMSSLPVRFCQLCYAVLESFFFSFVAKEGCCYVNP